MLFWLFVSHLLHILPDVSDEFLEAPLGMAPLERQGAWISNSPASQAVPHSAPEHMAVGGHGKQIEQIFPDEVKSFTELGAGVHA